LAGSMTWQVAWRELPLGKFQRLTFIQLIKYGK